MKPSQYSKEHPLQAPAGAFRRHVTEYAARVINPLFRNARYTRVQQDSVIHAGIMAMGTRFFRTGFVFFGLVLLIVFGGLKGARLFLEQDVRSGIAKEFSLSDEGADVVLQCIFNDDDFGFTDPIAKRRFCGCLGTDIAGMLGTRELELAAFMFEQDHKHGIPIPTSGTAHTNAAARVATALQYGMDSCRYSLG